MAGAGAPLSQESPLRRESPGDRHVLYLEDAVDHALLVQAFFAKLPGYSVTHLQDGDRALELIEERPWDLLVTDLNLPGFDGFTVMRRMRSVSPSTPILVTTGYTQPEYEEQALRAGADHVLIKPLDATEFTHRVRALVESRRAEPAPEGDAVLAVEGQPGDAEMGCGGSLRLAVEEGHRAVVLPILLRPEDGSDRELKAASLAAGVLGFELRMDRALFGDREAQRDLLERTIAELRPRTVYVPAADDADPSRLLASRLGRESAPEVPNVLGYQTATTSAAFAPARFVDVRKQMVPKMEALATYQSVGSPRIDLRPRMAQAYARYWGRLRDFTEVEAFEIVRSAT